jgi:MoxR-like ATPase
MKMTDNTSKWPIYRGEGGINTTWSLPPPPPWRPRRAPAPIERKVPSEDAARAFIAGPDEIDAVNAALFLRRPLLITGNPGVGKSSLARAVAKELGLGDILWWPITSRTTLRDGLYDYDALGRLQDVARQNAAGVSNEAGDESDISQYLTLGPLGTALLPGAKPRVLLIDEVDKGDIDLPNELLHVFEEGKFEIPELVRVKGKHPTVNIRTKDGDLVPIQKGWVHSYEFPLVLLTSNGEREFPPAFMRRCIRVEMRPPLDAEGLAAIVAAHLPHAKRAEELIDTFSKRGRDQLATDQLLNAVYLATYHPALGDKDKLIDVLFKGLSGFGST